MKYVSLLAALIFFSAGPCFAQKTDTVKAAPVYKQQPFFIITAGEKINAYYNDKPLEAETIEAFNEYVQKNAKSLKDARVVITGKPKVGTFDEVLKTLNRYRIKNITKNISN